MPLAQPGADLAITIDPGTSRAKMVWGTDGNPVFDDTQAHRVYSLVLGKRGLWWADTRGNRGSLLYTIGNVRQRTPSDVQTFILDALDKAVREGWIQPGVQAAARVENGRIKVAINYSTWQGRTIPLRYSIPT